MPRWYARFLSCFFNLLNFFGLFLPLELHRSSTNAPKYQKLKKYYAVILSVLLIAGYSYSKWLGFTTIYKTWRVSNIILTILVDTSLTCICLLFISGNVFWNQSRWSQYIKLQNILKNKMHLIKIQRDRVHFVLEVVIGHLIFVAVVAVDQYRNVLKQYNNSEISSTIIKDILYYLIFLITIIIFNMALLLKNDFTALKYFLTNSVQPESSELKYFSLYRPTGVSNIIFPKFSVLNQILRRLQEVPKMINILFECIDLFNDNLGIIILLLNFSTVVIILSSLNNLLVGAELNQLNADEISFRICEFLVFLIWNSYVSSACGLLKEECEIVIKLCCKLQHFLPRISKERHELLNIARQVHRKCPRVSAAGFYDVDFGVMFYVFSYAGTYIVVLIQLSHIDF